MTASPASKATVQKVYLDLTHLGRHVTGLERIAIELFEKQDFAGAIVKPVRAHGLFSMVVKQQLLLPLLALFNPSAKFVFPGFPPSPLFAFAAGRTFLYVHDLFLLTRRADLSRKAKLYMAWPFRVAVSRLKTFLVNSEKTRAELAPFVRADATITLYRPAVRNVFQLSPVTQAARDENSPRLRVVSVGTVEPRKNYMAAATIVAELNLIHEGGADLHIVGRAGWGSDGEHLALFPNVIVHGFLAADEAKRIIEDADLYLCTSHDEGLGLPLLEVQYAGLPVLAPDQAVFREVLSTSATFIDPANALDAATRILALVAAPGWRTRAAQSATANIARWNTFAAHDAERAQQMFADDYCGARTATVEDRPASAPKLRT